jgi:PRC-barrel domain
MRRKLVPRSGTFLADESTPRQGYTGGIRHRLEPPSAADGAAERKAGMFEAADIREWRGHDVVDPDGHKIGELEAVYVDTTTDLAAFGTVKVGMPTRHRLAFVPLAQAVVGPGYLKVAYDRKQVKDSPSITTDGELPAADEEAIFKHYGLPYQAGAGGERQLARR